MTTEEYKLNKIAATVELVAWNLHKERTSLKISFENKTTGKEIEYHFDIDEAGKYLNIIANDSNIGFYYYPANKFLFKKEFLEEQDIEEIDSLLAVLERLKGELFIKSLL